MQNTRNFGSRQSSVEHRPRQTVANPRTKAQADSLNVGKILVQGSIAFFTFWLIEALLSSTSLITPISWQVSYAMRGLGLLTGLAAGIWFLRVADAGWGKKTLVLVFSPFLFAAGCEGVAWRMGDWWEFGLSNAPFEVAQYPVKGASPMTNPMHSLVRHNTIDIDPFRTGIPTSIPVPQEQFDAIWLHATDYCIVVEQRRSPTGAIEIRTEGEIMLGMPKEVELIECPEVQHGKSSGKPG
jgi:hypothetical protein